jgi:hypothetical protein
MTPQEKASTGSPNTLEVLDLCGKLCEDPARLRLKWVYFQDLFRNPEHAALLVQVAPAFFETIAESLRFDIVMTICRLADPSRSLGGDVLSLASLAAQCQNVPNLEHLLTAFQSAAGCVRLYRHRRLPSDQKGPIVCHGQELLPDVGPAQIDEILRLAVMIPGAIHEHYTGTSAAFEAVDVGGALDLVKRLSIALPRVSGEP